MPASLHVCMYVCMHVCTEIWHFCQPNSTQRCVIIYSLPVRGKRDDSWRQKRVVTLGEGYDSVCMHVCASYVCKYACIHVCIG